MPDPIDLTNLRRDYHTQPLERSDLAADPIVQFQRWFAEALDTSSSQPARWAKNSTRGGMKMGRHATG